MHDAPVHPWKRQRATFPLHHCDVADPEYVTRTRVHDLQAVERAVAVDAVEVALGGL